MNILEVKKVYGTDYLNFYSIVFDKKVKNKAGEEVNASWDFVSRTSDVNELECVTRKQKFDSVCIIPKFIDDDGDEGFVIIEEMRYPIGNKCFSFPAGLIDEGEVPQDAALRELKEEIGAEDVLTIEPFGGLLYNSEGMTDETVQMFEVSIGKIGKQDLQGLEEEIGLHFVKTKDLKEFMVGKRFSAKAGIYLQMAIRMYEMKK